MSEPRTVAWRFGALLLPALMLAGTLLGFLVGGLWGARWKDPGFSAWAGLFRLGADIFMNLLKMLIVPLIIFSVIHAVAGLGDLRRAGRTFALTFSYYILTTLIAVAIGILLVNAIRPGEGVPLAELSEAALQKVEKARSAQGSPLEKVYDVIRGMFPPNLVHAASEGQVLGLIMFSLFFGAILGTLGPRGSRVAEFIGTLNNAVMIFVRLVIWFAPVGILCLVAERIGQAGGPSAIGVELQRLSWYAVTVIGGLALHGFLVLPLLLWVFGRRNPLRYVLGVGEALLCAFTTASSAATLPLTVRCSEEHNAISKQAAGFVLPLGATVNMDGTALYEAVAALFIAQAYGIELDFASQLVILLTATLAAIGAAAIPEAGLVTMVIVLVSVNLPVEGIGLILAIDWILDRFRTTINVWGDCVGVAIVDRWLSRSPG